MCTHFTNALRYFKLIGLRLDGDFSPIYILVYVFTILIGFSYFRVRWLRFATRTPCLSLARWHRANGYGATTSAVQWQTCRCPRNTEGEGAETVWEGIAGMKQWERKEHIRCTL
jgi:hypothetical protein